jgi:hypothetical protein
MTTADMPDPLLSCPPHDNRCLSEHRIAELQRFDRAHAGAIRARIQAEAHRQAATLLDRRIESVHRRIEDHRVRGFGVQLQAESQLLLELIRLAETNRQLGARQQVRADALEAEARQHRFQSRRLGRQIRRNSMRWLYSPQEPSQPSSP